MSIDAVCPACCNVRVRFGPLVDCAGGSNLAEYPCPVCCSSLYPNGFEGEKIGTEWIIPPYGPGDIPIYRGWLFGIPEENPGR